MQSYLDFEKPLAELQGKIQELRQVAGSDGALNVGEEIDRLELKSRSILEDLYGRLSRWQKTQVARHPGRPHAKDYVDRLITEFAPLGGDRNFAEDHAIVSGLGRLGGRSVVILGHEKGHDTETRLKRNFGMARPEGYRKSIRLMDMAERFRLPVVAFVDTPGAFPGKGAEERGQAEAIARSIDKCLSLTVPMVSVVIGEGGSGGAVAIAASDRVLMLEHAVYSVISPEGCASILWRDAAKADEAAEAMRVTAQDLLDLRVVDHVIEEPVGGAHRDSEAAIAAVGAAVTAAIDDLSALDPSALKEARRAKFLAIGRAGLS